MSFDNFDNPFQDPTSVPDHYRKHAALQKLFKTDGTYVRYQIVPLQTGTSLPRVSASDVLNVKLPIPKDLEQQIEIGEKVAHRRIEAKRLRAEAETVVAEAKVRVERMILGQEEVQ